MPVVNYIWDVVSDNDLMEVDDEGNTLARYVQEPDLYGKRSQWNAMARRGTTITTGWAKP